MKKQIYIIILITTLVCYFSVFIPPHIFWFAGFITYLIPFILIINLIILILDIKNLRLSFLLPLVLLIAGWGFIRSTFQFPLNHKEGPVKVLSYNIHVFNIYDPESVFNEIPQKMAGWIQAAGCDIICLQEFYSEPDSPARNTISMINREKTYNIYNLPVFTNRIGAQFGNIIFSRYPIVRRGQVEFAGHSQNQAIFADLLIDTDTVRVYNLHLQSMHINEKEMMNYEGDIEEEVRDLAGRLKFGFIQRSLQIRTIREHILSCPYQVIVCGDFNDIPYSYAYHELKDILHNSFTESGSGFGFTYNGKLPFLRIDNQFHSNGIKSHSLKTVQAIKYSDHYPLIGTYSIAGK